MKQNVFFHFCSEANKLSNPFLILAITIRLLFANGDMFEGVVLRGVIAEIDQAVTSAPNALAI